jgi:CubicO group peptidase (beta-lactamase class C family)
MYFIRVSALIMFGFVNYSCKTKDTNKQIEQEPIEIKKIDSAQVRKEINANVKAAQIAALINEKIKGGFNGNVLVVQKGITIFQKSVGYATDTVLLNKDSKFQLASLSKTFTSVAIMKLVEEGKVGLDNTVQDYYPEFPYDGVTIRSLLSHRSGLPYYQYEFDLKVRTQKIYPSNQQIVEWFCKAVPTPKILNQPDHFFSYNNTNFAILAAIVEKVSGKSFDIYLKEKVLQPAGMYDTFTVNTLDPRINVNRTVGYQFGRKVEKDYYDNITGDKGIYSTTGDLLKWYKMLKSETVLNKESLREIYTPRSFEQPGLRNYGYGFRLWVNELQQTDYIYHTGWWKGYNTIMFFDLREDFVIILLSNKFNRSVYNIKEIVNALHGSNKMSTIEENILDQ